MSTKIQVFLKLVYHCEEGQTALLICRFSVNLVCTGAVPIQLSVWQGYKCVIQGAKAAAITVGDHYVHSYTRLYAFPWSRIVTITLLVNKK